ncbi:MAG: hypothetical protein WBN70_10815 [Polyangiales bacterium]
MRTHLLSLVILAVIGGCSSKPKVSDPPTAAEKKEEAAAAAEVQKPRPMRVFDVDGRLIPSDEYVAGVRLPRGVELFRADEVTHVYRMRAPIDKVLAYFGPMMITGNVERRGKGAVYKRASVRGAEVNPTKVDLSILEVGSNLVRISVTELPPPPTHIPGPSHTKAAAADTWRTLD